MSQKKHEKETRSPEELIREGVEAAREAAQEAGEAAADRSEPQPEEPQATGPEDGAQAAPEAEQPAENAESKQLAEMKDRLQRQMAEFDNYRKRTDKEKAAQFEIGQRSVIERILPVVDNFERGMASIAEADRGPVYEGMEKVYKQLMTTLHELGVEPIEAVGKPFDPNLHNAVMHVEDDAVEESTVVEEFQKGYTCHGAVVRVSMVKVAN